MISRSPSGVSHASSREALRAADRPRAMRVLHTGLDEGRKAWDGGTDVYGRHRASALVKAPLQIGGARIKIV